MFGTLFAAARPFRSNLPNVVGHLNTQVRFRGQLAPKRTRYRKAHKGRIPVRTGGSTKGTTVELGDFGLRVLEGVRLSAKQLQTFQDAVKKALKVVKGAQVHLRVFPDIPVCIKGNETRMGKGKGTFEFWACRVPVGKVIMEVGGGGLRAEIARTALQLAANKMPVKTEFVSRDSPAMMGLLKVPRTATIASTSTTTASATTAVPSSTDA